MSLTNLTFSNGNSSQTSFSNSDKINIILFTFLLVTTLAMAIILHLYRRHLHDGQQNVLVLLQNYLIDCILLFTLSMIIPVLIRLTIGPMSFIIAEIFMMIIYVKVCLLIIVTAASSIIKLLLVAKFGLIFSLDPQQLAVTSLGVAIILAFLPNILFTCWILLGQNQCASTITVAYFMNNEHVESRISLGTIYLLLCLLFSLILLVLVVFWIPQYLRRAHSSVAIREGNVRRHSYLTNNISI
jgi:hypothetical protein